MSLPLETIQTTARIDERGILHGIEPLAGFEAGEVQVVVIRIKTEAQEEMDLSEISETQWCRAMSRSSALAFLSDPTEDIFTMEDGEPFVFAAQSGPTVCAT